MIKRFIRLLSLATVTALIAMVPQSTWAQCSSIDSSETATHTDEDHDGICDVCESVVLSSIISMHGVTASLSSESMYPWAVSTQEGCMPGLMATTTAESSITFSSTEPFTLSFSVKLLISWVMTNPEFFDWDPAGNMDITLDGEVIFGQCIDTEERISKKLAAGAHTLNLRFEVDYPSSEPKAYVYNIIACNHTEDTSLPTTIPATCTHGTYETQTCSICGDTYETPEADDMLPHSDEDKNGYCDVCGETVFSSLITAYGVTVTAESDSDYPWTVSTRSEFSPGMMSGNAGRDGTSSSISFTFTSSEEFKLSFSYAVSSEYNYDKLNIYLDENLIISESGNSYSSFSTDLLPGSHNLKVIYSKDDTARNNDDRGYIYNINVTSTIPEYTLVDATEYAGNEIKVKDFTYIRNVKDSQVNRWQALYVPFQMSYNDWKEDFDVAAINNFHEYSNAEGLTERVELEIRYIKNGKLKANHPYLIRPKSAGEKTITLQNVQLAKSESNSISCSSVERKYTFTGSYEPVTGLKEHGYIFLSNGNLCQTDNDDVTLSAQRWYLTVEELGSQCIADPRYINVRIIDEEDEATGIEEIYTITSPLDEAKGDKATIYDLQGRHISVVSRGLNIIRTEDGKAEKIMVK